MNDQLAVSELFYSVAGEGLTLGMPAIFLRLAGCNLRCGLVSGWKCDTPYTWDWQQYDVHQEVRRLTIDDLLAEQSQYNCFNLVVTGGEPLVQQQALGEFLRRLKQLPGWHVEVETNGTIVPNLNMQVRVDQWNVSPKLSSSGNALESRVCVDALMHFSAQPNAFFKFVVATDEDVREMEETFLRPFPPTASPIYLMAEGKTPEEQQEHTKWLIEVVKRSGGKYWYTPRAQVLIWGTRRGV